MKADDDLLRSSATIAAIATPPGDGGVAIIRLSGNSAIDIAATFFSGPVATYKSHTLHYGSIFDLQGHVDDVLLAVMLAPKSYTGENTVEIYCHGGALIARRVLETALSAGARAARPGEFTLRAFLNDKLDLAQAEAVQMLIGAKNERALSAADNQLQGRLSEKVRQFQSELTHLAAILEAWVDFPDEGLEFASLDELTAKLDKAASSIEHLVATFHEGRIIQDGVAICLVGAPNVGKSSLMNALLDKDRAIVSPIPGTTRDIIEDAMRLKGLHIRLIDTAGIRSSEEQIEQEGIKRSHRAMGEADILLWILDSTKDLSEGEEKLAASLPHGRTIAVWNKCDLPRPPLPQLCLPQVEVSAQQRWGLEALADAIERTLWRSGAPQREEIIITNIRHKESLSNAASACRQVIAGLQTGISPEFVISDLRAALQALGRIIGTHITEDILTAIFSTFCIGK